MSLCPSALPLLRHWTIIYVNYSLLGHRGVVLASCSVEAFEAVASSAAVVANPAARTVSPGFVAIAMTTNRNKQLGFIKIYDYYDYNYAVYFNRPVKRICARGTLLQLAGPSSIARIAVAAHLLHGIPWISILPA